MAKKKKKEESNGKLVLATASPQTIPVTPSVKRSQQQYALRYKRQGWQTKKGYQNTNEKHRKTKHTATQTEQLRKADIIRALQRLITARPEVVPDTNGNARERVVVHARIALAQSAAELPTHGPHKSGLGHPTRRLHQVAKLRQEPRRRDAREVVRWIPVILH